MRPGAQVRLAVAEDLVGLVALCQAARAESGAVGPDRDDAEADLLRDQLSALLVAPGSQILIGILDDAPAGLLLARVVGPGPFALDTVLQVEALYVDDSARRRGLGHALLAGACDEAAKAGATQVYAVHLPGARGVQRFFVRMGFVPAAAHRVVATHTLQRRLAGPPVGAGSRRRGAARGLEELIARRRQVRTETETGPVDLRDVAAALAMDAADQAGGRESTSRQVKRAVASRRDAESSTTIS